MSTFLSLSLTCHTVNNDGVFNNGMANVYTRGGKFLYRGAQTANRCSHRNNRRFKKQHASRRLCDAFEKKKCRGKGEVENGFPSIDGVFHNTPLATFCWDGSI